MSTSRCHRTHAAERDLADLAAYLGQEDPSLALRFLDAAEATFELLTDVSEMGSPCLFESPRAEGLRVWAVRGFRSHLIFYRPTDEGISVIRVLHAARDIERVIEE